MYDEDLDPVRGGPKGIGDILQGICAGDVAFWVRDVDPDPPYGAGPEQISAQGCAIDHRETSEAAEGGFLVISSAGGSNGGSGLRRYQGLRHEEAEYSRTIYCDANSSGPL